MKNSTATPLRALMLALALVLACIASQACGPRPQPPSSDPAHVSSWTDTARTVLSTLRWAVPGAKLVTDALLPEPPRTIVGRALDGVTTAADGLAGGLSGVGWISDAAVWITALGLPVAGPVLGSRSL